MKTKLIIFNTILLGVIIPFMGGGAFAKLGYFFLLGALLIAFILFGELAGNNIFSRKTIWLYLFLLFHLFSSTFDLLGCVALFGRLSPPIFFFILYSILKKRPDLITVQKWFVAIWLIALCFFEIQALKFLSENPMGLRELVSTEKDDSLIVGGGFSLPYALALLVPGLFLFCKIGLSGKLRMVFLALCLFYGFLVVSALYMTAIILMIAGVGLAIVHGYTRRRKILLTSTLIISVIVVYEFIPMIIEEYSPEGTNVLLARFHEIDSVLSGNNISESSDFFSRIQLSLKSIGTFLENPLFGIGWKCNYDFFALEAAGVGSHAQWFDLFASYGLFAITILFYLKKSAIEVIKKDNITLLLFVFLGFLNPCLQYTIVFSAFCLVPMFRVVFTSISEKVHSN